MTDDGQERWVEHQPPESLKPRRRWLGNSGLAEPQVSYVGPVAIWWIPKPRGPRVSLWAVAIAWLVLLPLTAATMLWLQSLSRPLWPFGRPISLPAEIILRYELILLICLIYVTIRSLPGWFRYRRLARQDAAAITEAIQTENWEPAALLMHRYCLLVSSIWRRVPSWVSAWDDILRKKLPRHRRLYVYYRGAAPKLPSDSAASFTPAIIPPPRPSLWWVLALIPIAWLLYMLIVDIVQHGHWQRIILFNAALLALILLSYGLYFLMMMLGRSHYFRFAPGVVQLVKFMPPRQRPAIETFNLRQMHVILDVSSSWPAMTLLVDPAGRKRDTFRLPQGDEAIEAILRATLSTAPSPPLPEDHLLE